MSKIDITLVPDDDQTYTSNLKSLKYAQIGDEISLPNSNNNMKNRYIVTRKVYTSLQDGDYKLKEVYIHLHLKKI